MLNNMQEIWKKLPETLSTSIKKTNQQEIFKKLDSMKEPVLCSGVGGSMPVAIFASKIFQEKANVLSTSFELLDILQRKRNASILLFSHSGKNYGIKKVIENNSNTYLFTTRKSKIAKEVLLSYQESQKEKSFISMQNTLLPMYILASYYQKEIKLPNSFISYDIPEFQVIEIMTDYTTKTASAYIESTCIEASIAPVIVHDKYSFCHGRTTTTNNQNNLIIYLISHISTLDNTILNVLKRHNKKIITIEAWKRILSLQISI